MRKKPSKRDGIIHKVSILTLSRVGERKNWALLLFFDRELFAVLYYCVGFSVFIVMVPLIQQVLASLSEYRCVL